MCSCDEELSPPGSPSLVSPQNNNAVDGYTVTFTWNETPLADNYIFQLSLRSDFNSTILNSEDLTTPSVTASDLNPSTTYYWRVKAMNSEGASAWSTIFKFETVALSVPLLVTPVNNSIVPEANLTFEWNEVSDANGYALQISTSIDFSSLVVSESISSTSHTYNLLLNSTGYFWRVCAIKNNIKSAWSATGNFNTEAVKVPGLLAPTDNSTNLPRVVNFSWNVLPAVDSYQLQVSMEEDFENQIIEKTELTNSSYTFSGLMFSTNYYWRVRAEKSGKVSDWSETRRFTTEALGIPILQSPLNNVQLTNYLVAMNWDAVPEATSYNLQVSQSSDFSSTVLNKTGLVLTTFSTSLTKSNTQYYWRVNAQFENCQSEWSAVRTFTTPLIPSDGLVAWYPFNGNANDESGNGRNGTVVGGVNLTADRTGQENKAYSFNGISGYIEVPSLNNFQYKPVTYSAWVIVPSYFPLSPGHKFRSIIGRQESGCQSCGMMGFFADQNILTGSKDNTFLYWIGQASTPDIPNSKLVPELNKWVHVVFTQSASGDFKFYINGILTNSGNIQNTQSANISFRIGSGTNGYFWNNKIDDVRIYSRVLTEEEVIALYNE